MFVLFTVFVMAISWYCPVIANAYISWKGGYELSLASFVG